MLNILKALTLALFLGCSMMFLYWLGGGSFERGESLQGAAIPAILVSFMSFIIAKTQLDKQNMDK